MPINKINNVSFGAKLILDEQSNAFIKKQEKKEGFNFYQAIKGLGDCLDTVEISNLSKHRSSLMLKDEYVGANNKSYNVYMTKPRTIKYTADVKINNISNKYSIEIAKGVPIWSTQPLRQLVALISNEFSGKEFETNIIDTIIN